VAAGLRLSVEKFSNDFSPCSVRHTGLQRAACSESPDGTRGGKQPTMDPQATFALLQRAVYSYLHTTTKETRLAWLDEIEESALYLRDWLALGGFAPKVTVAEAVRLGEFLATDTYGHESAKRAIRECVRLITAAQPAQPSPLLAE
jgi:hypothetical protein